MKSVLIACVTGLTAAMCAGADITWKGDGETTAWSDGSNWEGGVAPGSGDTAVIPSGKTAGMSSADVTYVSAAATKLAGISLPDEDAELVVTNSSAATLSVPLSGSGVFRVENNGAGTLTLGGNNINFTGPMFFTDSKVGTTYTAESTTRRHFGRDNTITMISRGAKQSDLCFFASGTYPNVFSFVGPDEDRGAGVSFVYSYTAVVLSGAVSVSGNVKFSNQQSGTLKLTGGVDHTGESQAAFMGGTFDIKSGGLSRFACSDAIDLSLIKYGYYGYHAGLIVQNNATVNLYDGVTADSSRLAVSQGKLRFQGVNRLPANVALQSGVPAGNITCTDVTFDLNGFDQQCGTIYKMSPYDEIVVTSAKPATLTCYGQFEHRGNSPKSVTSISMALNGQASFTLCATNRIATPQGVVSDYNAQFVSKTSTTSGSVTAKKGRITLGNTTSWPNVKNLMATGTGTLTINTSDVNPDGFRLIVSNAVDSAVKVAEGVTLRAKSMYVDKWLEPGIYGGPDAELDEAHTLAKLTGKGRVQVKEWGGPKGLAIIFR